MNTEKPQIPEELDKGIKKLIGTLKKSMKLILDKMKEDHDNLE